MSHKRTTKQVAMAVGVALAGSFAVTGVASADTGASPFAMTTLGAGYMLGAGEANPGGDKKAEGSCGEDKKGEGSCGADKDAEGKCGEGKCGGAV